MVPISLACGYWRRMNTPQLKEIVMNHIRGAHPRGRLAVALAALAGALLAFGIASPPAFAFPLPPSGGPAVRPAPAHHVIVSGGMPGWQIALIATGAAVVAAVMAVLLDRAWAARRNIARLAT
jgi:hypothetical protein